MACYDDIKEAIRKPWLSVFIDGQTGGLTYLLPVPPHNTGMSDEEIEALLDTDELEGVYSDAKSLGFVDGCVIVLGCVREFDEWGSHYEVTWINVALTELMHGTAAEQCRQLTEGV